MARTPAKSLIKAMSSADYSAQMPVFEALREEVSFILRDSIENKSIKIHAVESRVKEFISFSRKLQKSSGSEFIDVEDIVGARVICLFKSDLLQVSNLIRDQFNVIKEDDKISSSDDSFGYMSIHFICQMKDSYSGPRYNKIKDTKFEIQIRTLCMHAWAAISHYLDYKSEWDIPEHLRKGLNALSGLFYVADEQYERLYDARQESRSEAGRQATADSDGLLINLDTVTAFAARKYPDREAPHASDVSTVVKELTATGYKTIDQIEADIDSVADEFAESEARTIKNQNVGRSKFYTQTGALRVSLGIANPKYKEIMDRK